MSDQNSSDRSAEARNRLRSEARKLKDAAQGARPDAKTADATTVEGKSPVAKAAPETSATQARTDAKGSGATPATKAPAAGADRKAGLADAAATGAAAAKGVDTGATAQKAPAGGSGWSKARKRLAEASNSVGNQVGSKMGEVRGTIARNTSAEEVPAGEMVASAAPAAAAGTTPAPTAVRSGALAPAAGQSVTRRTRKARLRLARLDPWSVFKTVLLFSVAGGIIFFIATWVVWGVINASGVFTSVNKAVNDLVASPGSTTTFRLEDYVNTHRILGFAALISVLDAILFTALATLFSFLYNLAATVMGGLEVTLAED